jgi:hypothetical protein
MTIGAGEVQDEDGLAAVVVLHVLVNFSLEKGMV